MGDPLYSKIIMKINITNNLIPLHVNKNPKENILNDNNCKTPRNTDLWCHLSCKKRF